MKKILCSLFLFLVPLVANAGRPEMGFFKTISEKTGTARAIVRLYPCGANMCGRIVALFNDAGTAIQETIRNPQKRADKVKDNPFVDGLDIIWGMTWNDRNARYDGGRIMDPEDGATYSARIWTDDADPTILNVRGSIGPFGRTQTWHAVAESDLPKELHNLDTSGWTLITR